MDSNEKVLKMLQVVLSDFVEAIREEQQSVRSELTRIADHFDPPPADIVGTHYLAERIGCTLDYVGEMAREGAIPHECIVPGSGNGKAWRFFRKRIDRWIKSR